MEPTAKLSLEQRFRLAAIQKNVDNLTLDEAKKIIMELTTQSFLKDELIKEWMRAK